MDELWQTEWCPSSRRVRQRLTELGVDVVLRQVAVEREDRDELRAATGVDSIPVLVTDDAVLVGEEQILARLVRQPAPAGAAAHVTKAAQARRRYLEEECGCPPTP
jgi:glutathione S-transferase